MRLVLKLVLYLVFPLMFAFAIFCGIRYLIQPLTLSSSAMIPNLKKGEHLLIERFTLEQNKQLPRFSVVAMVPPYVDGKVFHEGQNEHIKHWFGNLTGLPGLPRDPVCIRRIIGLPGEKIQIDPVLGILIDGKQIDENAYISAKHAFNPDQSTKLLDQAETVPANSYFVLPDNRRDFGGSEAWGFVEKNRLTGVVSYKVVANSIKKLPDPSVTFSDPKVAFNDDGVKALHKSNFKESIALFYKSLSLDPDYQVAKENLSIAYSNYAFSKHETPKEALELLHKAFYIDPENEMTKKNLDCLLQLMGKDPKQPKDRIELAKQFLAENKELDAYVEFAQARLLGANPGSLSDMDKLARQNFSLDEICRVEMQ
ncbi:signal peptidase I [bacterium]|nr:signal peptidase I [bacterium]